MNRRNFLRNSALTAAGVVAAPYILPTGRLFAASGSRLANHVVFCMFSGGVRILESVQKAEGNLMRGMLNGTEAISSDIGQGLTLFSPPNNQPVQNYGTLFKQFRFSDGPTGHFNGHTTAITGQNTDYNLSLRASPTFPTIFEYYRKHNSPAKSAINSWWISHSNNLYPILNYSSYDGYGPDYGANQLSPTNLFNWNVRDEFSNMISINATEQDFVKKASEFMNKTYKGGGLNVNSGIKNNSEDAAVIQAFMDQMFQQNYAGMHSDPWGTGYMNGDMYNVFFAEEVLKTIKPELLVVNMFGVDTAHSNFTDYCHKLHQADYAVAHLWKTIQSTPGLQNDTVLIVAPEIGRNSTPNSIIDQNGRGALDHTSDNAMAREMFCLVAGPSGVIQQNKVVDTLNGKSIDIVPTIAHILGFWPDIQGMVPGSPLYEAF